MKIQPQLIYKYSEIKKNLNEFKLDIESIKENKKIGKNIWIYGNSMTGKTVFCYKKFPKLFNKMPNKWWDGYIGQNIVLLDDLDTSDNIIANLLKKWADNRRFHVELKNGTILVNYKLFLVTSYYKPQELYYENEKLVNALNRTFVFGKIIGSYPNFEFVMDEEQYGAISEETKEFLEKLRNNENMEEYLQKTN